LKIKPHRPFCLSSTTTHSYSTQAYHERCLRYAAVHFAPTVSSSFWLGKSWLAIPLCIVCIRLVMLLTSRDSFGDFVLSFSCSSLSLMAGSRRRSNCWPQCVYSFACIPLRTGHDAVPCGGRRRSQSVLHECAEHPVTLGFFGTVGRHTRATYEGAGQQFLLLVDVHSFLRNSSVARRSLKTRMSSLSTWWTHTSVTPCP
jgi:hypothetical protein